MNDLNLEETEIKIVDDIVKLCTKYNISIQIDKFGAKITDCSQALSEVSEDTITSEDKNYYSDEYEMYYYSFYFYFSKKAILIYIFMIGN